MSSSSPFTAIVLAADRMPDDPVARAAGVSCKALAPIWGIPMVLRVLGALSEAQNIENRILCGPAWHAVETHKELHDLIASGQVKWVEAQATPSSSAYAVMQSLPLEQPVLLVTADHALLSAQLIDYFCSEARSRNCDVAVGFAAYDLVASAYPDMKRTVMKFGDSRVCGCNLYAFLSARGRSAAAFWRQVEALRKKPIKLISALGWIPVFRYLLGRFTLREALSRLSRRLDLSIEAVMLPFPEAALDVDKVSDWELAQRIAGRKGS